MEVGEAEIPIAGPLAKREWAILLHPHPRSEYPRVREKQIPIRLFLE